MAKTKVSISLIKENVTIQNCIKNGTKNLKLSNGKTLFYKSNPPSEPKWINTFFSGGINNTDVFKTKSVSAVILYEIEITNGYYRIFAISFGYGRNLLNQGIIEERFGLKTSLNTIGYDQLRCIDVNSLEAVPLNNRIQSSALAGIRNFNIDIDKDLLKSVTGKSSANGLEGLISGADTLTITTDRNYDTIEDILRDCFNKYNEKSYLECYDWIDQIKAVKDKTLIEELDNLLIADINEQDPSNVWFSVPDILDWERVDCFKVISNTLYDDLDIQKLKMELDKEISLRNIKRQKVTAVDEQGNTYKSWIMYKCIYADINYQNKQFLLNEGKWYEIAENFEHQVNEFYKRSTISTIHLPDFSKRVEKEYNEMVVQSNTNHFCLMDRKNIMIGGTQVEFCDIYTSQKQFVHVKRYNGSAVLSHLFSQGLVSAEAFFDKQFRTEVNKKLTNPFFVDDSDSVVASDYEVVFVIARHNAVINQLPAIPFFSKITFRNISKRLQHYGYKVSITSVPYTFIDLKNN